MAEVENENEEGEEGSTSFHSWIHSHYFEFVKERDDKNILVVCKLCNPAPGKKRGQLSTAKRSTSNLKKHLDKVHPGVRDKLKEDSRKRKAEGDLEPVTASTSAIINKQPTINFAGSNRLHPREVRKLVAEYVVEDMLPLSTVESTAFRKIVGKIPVRIVSDKVGVVANVII